MAMQIFKNPTNNFKESFYPSNAVILTLLAAPLYFAIKGVWTHAVVSFVLAVFTACFSNVLYAFFVNQILRNYYLRKGWVAEQEARA
jgi:hypothetical protein